MTLVADVAKEKPTRKKSTAGGEPQPPPVKKKDKLTFRLKDAALAYKLGLVLEDRQCAAWEYIEPLIRDDVELDFAALMEKLKQLDREQRGGGGQAGTG